MPPPGVRMTVGWCKRGRERELLMLCRRDDDGEPGAG